MARAPLPESMAALRQRKARAEKTPAIVTNPIRSQPIGSSVNSCTYRKHNM